MGFRNLSAWSIRNPVPPIVVFIALLLAGVVSFMQMDVNQNPDIDFPGASINISQPGAAPSEMVTQVTQRVEAAVRGINGVDEINSSVREGNSNTFVQFAIGTPVDRAVSDVRDAISNIRGDLPDGILEPQVSRVDIAGGPIAYMAAESDDMGLEELSWYVDNTVAKRLLGISGMAAVERNGGVTREIRVTLDPARLQAYGVTAAQVNQQLRQSNLNAAGGRAEIAGSEQSVRVLGNAQNAFALGETQISLGGGRMVKLSDIAEVRDSYAEQRNIAKMNGRQVLSFSIERAKGASDVTVYDAVNAELKKLEKENPKVRYTQLFTSVDYTKGQYSSAMIAMLEGAALAVFVVFIFLRDWRATLISAVAIPLSAIPAFWFMSLLGFSLNELSLLALSLVAGVLVDDAIVEIENIVRHMRMGKSAYQASIDAADEIGLAVLATTMTIVAVFLPVGLMPGISGQFFKNFGLTVVVAVLMSLFVARMITPMMAAYLLKAHGEQSHGEGRLMDWYMRILHWSVDRSKALAAKQRGMNRVLARFYDNRVRVLGIGIAAFVATFFVFGSIPFTFQPTIDTDYSQVRIEMPPGATLKQTEAVTDRVRNSFDDDKTVQAAFSAIRVGSANIYMTLTKDRPMSSVEFERSWAERLAAIPDARVSFQSQSGGGPGGGGRDITIYLGGDDPVLLEKTAVKLAEDMKTLKGLRDPRVAGDLLRPEIVIKPRAALIADLGITTAAISQTIRIATLGDIDQNSAKFSLSDRQIVINVALSEASRRDLATIQNLPVPTGNGGTVPLGSVADISFGAGPTTIQRTNQTSRIAVGADLAPGLVSGDVNPLINELPTMKNMPEGVSRMELGDQKWIAELILNFVIAVVAGILMVFAVLVLLYKRIMPPLVNMGSLALAPLGGGLALLISGDPVSMPVMIGILMLLGIVGKNSILLVDFAIEEMDKGVRRFDAILDAGHKRAQPILMTTVAMVAGMVPIALSLSGDGSWRAPMGVTVIGGLIVSTILTLLIVPALFSLAVGVEQRLGPILGKLLTSGPDDPTGKTQPPATPPAPIAPQPAE
jgi:multidrug efflux pump subunit AcrB